jgi:hypothetical protein
MGKEKIMPFVEARAKLSEILDLVAERGDIYLSPSGKSRSR